MKRCCISLFFLFFCVKLLLSQTDFRIATEQEKIDFMNHLAKNSDQFTSFQCQFKQEKKIYILSETIVSEGVATFTKDNKMFCHYQKPNDCKYIINNNKLLIESNGKRNILNAKANKKINEIKEIILNVLNNNINLLSNYETNFYTNEKLFSVSIAPKNELKTDIKEIKLIFNQEKYFIDAFEFSEKSGNQTKFLLSNPIFDIKINDRIFEFQ